MSRRRGPLVVGMLAGLLGTLPAPAAAQLIGLRTIPVASGDQFLIYPSENLAIGGVRIALSDPLLDPFVNPARGADVTMPQVFAMPTFYSIGQNAGSAGTLSAGALFSGGRFFGGALLALQQIKNGEPFWGAFRLADFAVLPPDALANRASTNKYATGMVGMNVGSGVALGLSGTVSDLNAVDGVEHLYAMAAQIEQAGSLTDLRFGARKDLGNGGLLEGVAVFNRFDVTHDVYYVEWVLVDSTTWEWEQRDRLESNRDLTSTYGLQLGFQRPVGTSGWRVGGMVTGNYKDHAKIPNYEIVNIPRDPGHSTALDFGVGIAKRADGLTVGMDLIYEPAWSSTWAEADTIVVTVDGDTIPANGKTVENEFEFSNAFVHLGASYQVGPAVFSGGLRLRANDYHLDQWNNVTGETRRQDEQWMEWTPSWGARVRLKGVEFSYFGRVTTGTGRPGVAWTGAVAERAADAGFANDIVVPPGGPLTLQEADVWTHQFTVSVPIR
jgi:hypothetical protein